FWWRTAGVEARLLAPAAAIYGAVAASRLKREGYRAGVPVICIGNPTLGGAGKTPTALAVARMLKAAGERPAFLRRGYGGRRARPRPASCCTRRGSRGRRGRRAAPARPCGTDGRRA